MTAHQVWRWLWRLMLLSLLASGGKALAQAAGSVAPRTDVQWLEAIQAAAQRLNYRGMVVYEQRGQVAAAIAVFTG